METQCLVLMKVNDKIGSDNQYLLGLLFTFHTNDNQSIC